MDLILKAKIISLLERRVFASFEEKKLIDKEVSDLAAKRREFRKKINAAKHILDREKSV